MAAEDGSRAALRELRDALPPLREKWDLAADPLRWAGVTVEAGKVTAL